MGRNNSVNTVNYGFAKVFEPLLQSGWTSYMDMAIAILNDPELSNRYLINERIKGNIAKDELLLARFDNYKKTDKQLKNKKKDNKGIPITPREFAGLFNGLERNVELTKKLNDLMRDVISYMRKEESRMQQFTKSSSTRQLFIKREAIYLNYSDDRIAGYNLRPDTMQYVYFFKEIYKWRHNLSNSGSRYELNEIEKIKAKYGYSTDGFKKMINSKTTYFFVFRYANPDYSLIDDLKRENEKNIQEKEKITTHITNNLSDTIPGVPIESIDKAKDIDQILNELTDRKKKIVKQIEMRRELIKVLIEKKPKCWTKDIAKNLAAIINDTRTLNRILINQDKIDESSDVYAFHKHRFDYPDPDYLPSHITSIIFQNDHYLRNIKHSNNDVDYSHTLKELKLLLKKEDLTIEELKEIGYISNSIAWHLMHLGRKQKDSQRANEDIEIYVDALFKLHHHVHYIVEIHSIVESMILYRLKPETVMNDIIEPIIKLIKIMCGNNNDIKYYIGSLSKKTGLINKCKYFIEANSENSNNTILVAIVSMFLACITDNYADPYNTIHAFYETVEKDDSCFDNNNNLYLYYLLCYYEFEQSRMLIGKFIYDEDLSRNFIGEILYIITLIYDGDEEWFQRGCSKEFREDLDHYISEYSKEEKTFFTEQLLMILKKVRYAIQDYIIIDDSLDDEEDDSLDDEEDDSLDDEEDDEIEIDEEGLVFMNNFISILCKKNLSYREAYLLKEIKDSCSDVEMDEDTYNEINNLIKRGDLSREELDFIIEELEKAIEKAEGNDAAITNRVVDDDMEGLICKWSFEDCKKRIENIIKEAVSIGLNQEWVQLICFCFSFNIVATIRFNIEEKRISEEETAGALNWLKNFITEKVIWNDEKEIIKDYLSSVITDRLLSSRFNKSTDLNIGDW